MLIEKQRCNGRMLPSQMGIYIVERMHYLSGHYPDLPEISMDLIALMLKPRSKSMWLDRNGVDYRIEANKHASFCYDALNIPEVELELAGWVKISNDEVMFAPTKKYSDLSPRQYRFLRINLQYDLDNLTIVEGLEDVEQE